jgi:hypothetical protein
MCFCKDAGSANRVTRLSRSAAIVTFWPRMAMPPRSNGAWLSRFVAELVKVLGEAWFWRNRVFPGSLTTSATNGRRHVLGSALPTHALKSVPFGAGAPPERGVNGRSGSLRSRLPFVALAKGEATAEASGRTAGSFTSSRSIPVRGPRARPISPPRPARTPRWFRHRPSARAPR